MLCGAAPLPASSGKTNQHRLNRGGDRQANAALYRIAVCSGRTFRAGDGVEIDRPDRKTTTRTFAALRTMVKPAPYADF